MRTIIHCLYRFNKEIQIVTGVVAVALSNAILFSTVRANAASGVSLTSFNDIGKNVLCPIFDWAFYILMIVSIFYVLWAAFTYMRAQDDSDKVTKATKTITYAVVGIIVALIAKAVPGVIGSMFGASGTGACSS